MTRDQRREQTQRAIVDAAIELFSERGVSATAVEDIAAAAHIAPRTFYRHAVTKENALFIDDRAGARVIHRARMAGPEAPAVIAAIEQAYRDDLNAFDAASAQARHRALRIRKLVLSEPSLLVRALAREAEQAQELTTIVLEAALEEGSEEIDARTVVVAIGTCVRLAYDEWVRRFERGETVAVREMYDRARAGMAAYFLS